MGEREYWFREYDVGIEMGYGYSMKKTGNQLKHMPLAMKDR